MESFGEKKSIKEYSIGLQYICAWREELGILKIVVGTQKDSYWLCLFGMVGIPHLLPKCSTFNAFLVYVALPF